MTEIFFVINEGLLLYILQDTETPEKNKEEKL